MFIIFCYRTNSNFLWYNINNLIILLGDNDSSISETEAEIDNISFYAENIVPNIGFFNSLKTTIDSITLVFPSPDR
jgi:hypothetical protein